jgi:5-methylcytosine-specific restriction protein B
LASGDEVSIPSNLIFLATMNPFDRGVDEIDAAFERRFAKIAFNPDPDLLLIRLTQNGMSLGLATRVRDLFDEIQRQARSNPYGLIGHAYFWDVRTEEELESLWTSQMQFVFEKAYRLNQPAFEEIRRAWTRAIRGEEESGDGTTQPQA